MYPFGRFKMTSCSIFFLERDEGGEWEGEG